MYYVISIKTDEILSFNYTYLYNHTSTDLFHLLLEDTKNNLRFVNIYNDMQTSNNFINTQDTIHTYIENVYSICLLYSEFTYKNDKIILLTKNYIGKLKNGNYFHFKINNHTLNNIVTIDVFVSQYLTNIIKNKSIIYSNEITLYNKTHIDKVLKNIYDINVKCKLVHIILHKNITCSNLHYYLYNKIINHILSP